MRHVAFAFLLASAAAGAAAQPARPRTTAGASSDAAAGKRVFDAQCAWCHGNEADGGTGPNLHGRLAHATDLKSIVDIRSTRTAAAGNAPHGRTVYDSNGCASCHTVDGRGGILGPELTAIGGRRGAPYLREAIVKPEAAHPPGYVVVRAVMADGTEVRGIRVAEDVFWVHIRDARGLHTLQKSDLTSLDRQLDASLMPSYASRITAGDLDDLVAYLTTLRGQP